MKILYKSSLIVLLLTMVTMLSYSQCDYCDAEGGCFMKIDGVEFSEISNLDTDCDDGYEDYTDLTGTVTPGVTYTLTVFTLNSLSNNDYGVWIDWDQDCTFESSEMVVDEANNGQAEHNWDITVPLTATPGTTTMRIRLKSSGNNGGSPCGSTTFGEVEDYAIEVIPPAFGILEGTVTDMETGDALEGVDVNYGGYFPTTTDENGFYQYLVAYAGDWELTAEFDGFNDYALDITILDDETLVQDIEMTRPIIDVVPSSLSVTLELDAQSAETITLSNIGTGEMDWEADLNITSDEINDDWVVIDIDEGYLDADGDQDIIVSFDATDLILGNIYYADITFSSEPTSEEFVVPIEMVVGSLEVGSIQGNIFLDGAAPYNIGNVEEVVIATGPYYTSPDVNGDYNMTAYPGTYEVTATLYGYLTGTIEDVIVPEGTDVTEQDFSLTCNYGRYYGVITDYETGDVIEDALVAIDETDFETTTNVDGEYEIIIEAGTYDVIANHETYAPDVSENQVVEAESDTEVNMTLQYKCNYCSASAGCYTYIKGVKFKTISNTNTGCSGGYKDYTDFITSVWPDSTYTLKVYTQTATADVDYTVWIDWNRDCVFDTEEKVLCEVNNGQLVHTWDIYIPLDVTPGLSTMRIRTKMTGSDCPSQCGSETYGETEDYSINLLPIITGTLSGTITDVATGDGLAGAVVMVNNALPIFTDTEGDYSAEVYIGDWMVTCDMLGYNIDTNYILISDDETTDLDFALTHPTFDFDPEEITVEMENGDVLDTAINITNNGNGPIDWNAAIVLDNNKESKEFLDVQFQFPTEISNGETGIACDGQFFYTSRWSGMHFNKYALDGTWVETFTIIGVGFIRDMTYDGTYFYGSNDAVTVYKMDLSNQELIGTFVAPVKVRALAWNPDDEVFYAASNADSITAFDKYGNYVDSWETGPEGNNYYGFAYDNYSEGAPYLWGYAPIEDEDYNGLIQMELPSGDETGTVENIADIISGSVTNWCGGLFTYPNIVNGKWTLGGVVQDEWVWGLELADYDSWISMDLDEGNIQPGGDTTIIVHLAPNDLLPGLHSAHIHFTTVPNVQPEPYPIGIIIPGLVTPTGLEAIVNCLDVELDWIMSAGGDPEGWNVYRDEVLIDFVDEMAYTDPQEPGDYSYYVTAVFDGEESSSTDTLDVTVNVPDLLAPDPFALIGLDPTTFSYTFGWAAPQACIDPLGYNVYRSDSLLNQDGLLTEMSYTDSWVCDGVYNYYVLAMYQYGESDTSSKIPITVNGNPCVSVVTFNVVEMPANVPVEGATIDLDGDEMDTDNTGQAVFDEVEVGTYSYTVTADGYETAMGEITVGNDDIEENVELYPLDTYSAIFSVIAMPADVPLEGATVIFDGIVMVTDVTGQVEFGGYTPGDYDYTVSYSGEIDSTGIVTIVDEDVLVEVEFYFTAINELARLGFYVYPNPASDVVNIKSEKKLIKSISVFSNVGQQILRNEVNEFNYQLNVSGFEKGIYYIEIETKEGKNISKIIVE